MGLDVNLLDGRLYANDPILTYRRLRDEAPVYRDVVNGIWGISRYQDVVDVEKDTDRYTSSRGSRPRIVCDVSSINNDDPLHQHKRRLVARREGEHEETRPDDLGGSVHDLGGGEGFPTSEQERCPPQDGGALA